jgi:hypothetical protein
MGAYTQLWAGTTASPTEINGEVRASVLSRQVGLIFKKYLIPWARIGKAAPGAANAKLEKDMIAYLREQVVGY